MLKRIFLVFFTLLLTMVAQNQEPSLIFAYVVTHSFGEEETIVMDAYSGEILYSFGLDEKVCPLSISPDGNWFVYNQITFSQKNRLMNLATSDIYPLDDPKVFRVKWSDNGRWVAYLHEAVPNFIEVRAIPPATEFYRLELVNSGIGAYDFLFVDDNLLTATIPFDAINFDPISEVIFSSTNLGSRTEQTIELDQPWQQVFISPNGRFLLGLGLDNTLYTLNLETEAVYELDIPYIQWLPNQGATLGYITDNENGDIALVEASPENSLELDLIYPLILSPDGQSAVYIVRDTTNLNFSTLYFLDIASGLSSEIAFTSFYTDIRWLSATQLVHTYVDPAIENPNLTDLYFYDAETQEKRQLTDSPDLEDRFNCYRG